MKEVFEVVERVRRCREDNGKGIAMEEGEVKLLSKPRVSSSQTKEDRLQPKGISRIRPHQR